MEINCGFGFKSWGLQQSKKKTTFSVVSFLSWRAQKDCFATLQNLLRQTGVIPPFCCGSNPHFSGSNPGACNNLKKNHLIGGFIFILARPEGFEPSTFLSVVRCSIHLSHGLNSRYILSLFMLIASKIIIYLCFWFL